MNRRVLSALIATSLASLATTCTASAPAFAEEAAPSAPASRPVCGDRQEILKRLEERHQETRQALGLSADGGVLEVLVSPEGSWTILVTYPKRPTCVVAVGQAWQTLSIAGQDA
jgi:hypothetical protein